MSVQLSSEYESQLDAIKQALLTEKTKAQQTQATSLQGQLGVLQSRMQQLAPEEQGLAAQTEQYYKQAAEQAATATNQQAGQAAERTRYQSPFLQSGAAEANIAGIRGKGAEAAGNIAFGRANELAKIAREFATQRSEQQAGITGVEQQLAGLQGDPSLSSDELFQLQGLKSSLLGQQTEAAKAGAGILQASGGTMTSEMAQALGLPAPVTFESPAQQRQAQLDQQKEILGVQQQYEQLNTAQQQKFQKELTSLDQQFQANMKKSDQDFQNQLDQRASQRQGAMAALQIIQANYGAIPNEVADPLGIPRGMNFHEAANRERVANELQMSFAKEQAATQQAYQLQQMKVQNEYNKQLQSMQNAASASRAEKENNYLKELAEDIPEFKTTFSNRKQADDWLKIAYPEVDNNKRSTIIDSLYGKQQAIKVTPFVEPSYLKSAEAAGNWLKNLFK